MSDSPLHERDIVATDEMIKTLKASTFRKYAFGSAAVLAVVFAGTAAVIWSAKSGNDPEHLKEALRHMPPLEVVVKLDPNATVKLADGATVTIANPPLFNQAQTKGGGSGRNNNDPAIGTTVTVFKNVEYGDGVIYTGWNFANGAATSPHEQFCYYSQSLSTGNSVRQSIGLNGVIEPTPIGVKDQAERFSRCQWWNGSLG